MIACCCVRIMIMSCLIGHPRWDVVVMTIPIDSEELLVIVEVDKRVFRIRCLWAKARRIDSLMPPHTDILRLAKLSDILSIIDRCHDLSGVKASSGRISLLQ